MFVFILITGYLQIIGQTSKNLSKENIGLANSAYDNMQFSLAIKYYEKCPQNSFTLDDYKHLADCYWQNRNYQKSLDIYQKIGGQDKNKLTKLEQFRMGEIYTRLGQKAEGLKWLDNLDGYKEKKNTFTDTLTNALIDADLWKIK